MILIQDFERAVIAVGKTIYPGSLGFLHLRVEYNYQGPKEGWTRAQRRVRACNPRPLEEGILSKHLQIGLTILIPKHQVTNTRLKLLNNLSVHSFNQRL